VDLVAVVAPAPEHARLVKQTIAAGKDVYCEWPLSTNTKDSEELLALAEAMGVRHMVGLQRCMGPSARYTRDLVRRLCWEASRCSHDGQRGCFRPRDVEPALVGLRRRKLLERIVYLRRPLRGYALSFRRLPKEVDCVIETQFPFFTVVETGERIPNTNPNEVMVIGTL
jgi:hypothetical protein